MDMRSFRLNFELNAFVYERALCDEMARQFELDLAQASEFVREDDLFDAALAAVEVDLAAPATRLDERLHRDVFDDATLVVNLEVDDLDAGAARLELDLDEQTDRGPESFTSFPRAP